jgi:hypothetical protein
LYLKDWFIQQKKDLNGNNIPYFYLSYQYDTTNYPYAIARINLNEHTIENFIMTTMPAEIASLYNGWANNGPGLAATDAGVWLGSYNQKVYRFSWTTLQFEAAMDIPDSVKTITTDNHKDTWVHNYNSKVFRVNAGYYNDNTSFVNFLYDGTHLSCIGKVQESYQKIEEYPFLFLAKSDNHFNIYHTSNCLYTIYNLTGPVTKNNEDVLIVTYSLIDDASAP